MSKKSHISIMVGLAGLCVMLASCQRSTDSLAETGDLSGEVEAPRPFKAARVYARNLDKKVLYMVWTNQGRSRAVQ